MVAGDERRTLSVSDGGPAGSRHLPALEDTARGVRRERYGAPFGVTSQRADRRLFRGRDCSDLSMDRPA